MINIIKSYLKRRYFTFIWQITNSNNFGFTFMQQHVCSLLVVFCSD